MPIVNVLINGRAYPITCDDGEEEHLRQLAQFLDSRVRELIGSVGQVGDARLLLMAALLITDELSDARAKLTLLEQETSGKPRAKSAAAGPAEDSVAEALEKAASRLEAIAARLTGS